MNPSTPDVNGFAHFLIVAVVIYLAIMVVMLIATVKIVTKAGYSGWWVAVTFIPFIGPFIAFVLFFIFAFSEWPIQRELAIARSRGGGGYQPGPSGSPWAPSMPTPSYPPSGYGPGGYAPAGYPPSGYAAPAGADIPGSYIPGRDEHPGEAPAGETSAGDTPGGNRPSRYLTPRQDPPPPPPTLPSGGMV